MNILIHARGSLSSHTLNDYVDSKLMLVLGNYSSRIKRIDVMLSRLRSNKYDSETKCTLKIRLNQFKTIVVKYSSEDEYDAVNFCAHRAKRSLDKYINRMRKQQNIGAYQFA